MRRRLQRRRAAAANVLAAVNAASVRVQGSAVARATGIHLPEKPLAASNDPLVAMPVVPIRAEFMDEWPSFCELVAPPPGWAGVEAEQQTDPVFVAAAPPVLDLQCGNANGVRRRDCPRCSRGSQPLREVMAGQLAL